ncbi:MAG: ShlB/FhaC/HecB family hemolysin secretion/activation protein [Cyanobacteria bacterium P01_H01_bin.74]
MKNQFPKQASARCPGHHGSIESVNNNTLSGFFIAAVAFISAAILVNSPANAQVNTAPVQANPGLLTPSPTEVELDRNLKENDRQPIEELPEINLDVPEPPSIVELEGAQFQVNTLTIEGNTLIEDKEFESSIQAFEGKAATLTDLGELVKSINKIYQTRGYYTSLAYIPPQDVSQGDIVIKILEGTVGDISIAGNRFYRTSTIARYLDQGNGDPFSIPKLEENLREMNRRGDFRVRATLSPNPTAGKTDVRLDVEEKQPWQIALFSDSLGRPTIGTLRWGTELTNRNVFGFGDRFFAQWIGAAGTQTAVANYSIPVNRYGTEVQTSFSFTQVDVDLPKVIDNNDIVGRAYNYGILVSQPLDKAHVFTVDAGLNFRQVSNFFNDQPTGQDNIRTMQFGGNFSKFDRFGYTFARAQTAVGTTLFGGNRQFWKAEGVFNRVIRLPKRNLLLINGTSQFSPNPLPAAEQFQLGGKYSVRGYTEGLLIGDKGYSISVEHRWPIPFLGYVNTWLSDRVMGATFFDFGQTWQDNNYASFRVNADRPATTRAKAANNAIALAGAGLGVRARLTQYLQGFVDFGFGLINRTANEINAQPTARVYFGVRSELLPQEYKTWGNKERAIQVKPRFKKKKQKV